MEEEEISLEPDGTEGSSPSPGQDEMIVSEWNDRIVAKRCMRTQHVKEQIVYPDEGFFAKKDSSVKKNSAFVKKLKVSMTESQREPLMKEMQSLNLSRYISEVTCSLLEAKLKLGDIAVAIKICSYLHITYREFSTVFLDGWNKILPKKDKDLPTMNASKMRIDLRFFSELVSCGIFSLKEGLPLLGQTLTILINSDKDSHVHLSILLAFCKFHGDEFMGLVPSNVDAASKKVNIPLMVPDLLPAERQKTVNNLMKEYYASLTDHVLKDHKDLLLFDKRNKNAMMSRGEVTQGNKDQYEQMYSSFQRLLANASQLAELMGEVMQDLPQDIADPTAPDFDAQLIEGAVNIEIGNRFRGQAESYDPNSLWLDEDDKNFYTSFPDLKAMVPSILYRDSCKDGLKPEPEKEETKEEAIKEDGAPTPDPKPEESIEIDDPELLKNVDDLVRELEEEDGDEVIDMLLDVGADEEEPPVESGPQSKESDAGIEVTQLLPKGGGSGGGAAGGGGWKGGKGGNRVGNKVMMDAFTTSLTTCVNRDMIDKAALNFCTNLNTKFNRNKLVKVLFSVHRTRTDLLPFYGRLVKTLEPVMPHVPLDLISFLKQDFRFHVRKKDQINIESKIKTVRFIGELVKFSLFPKTDVINYLRILLHQFTHHQIEMTCALLETCGRFLYRSVDTHTRMQLLLEQMMRKRDLLHYDSRYIPTIENAFYAANPSDQPAIVRIERTHMQMWIRSLLYDQLAKGTVLKVMREVKKLEWDSPDVASYFTKCLMSVWNVKFYNIPYVADLMWNLKSFREEMVTIVIDGVLEDIQYMMEFNHPKFNQRRISVVKFFGELYNFRLISSQFLSNVLYQFISYGSPEPLDPPDHLFRIRLVCQLLETSGAFLSHQKVDFFLTYFERYFWTKRSNPMYQQGVGAGDGVPFPITITQLYNERMKVLRPKHKLVTNLDEANAAVEKLMEQLKAKALKEFPSLEASLVEGAARSFKASTSSLDTLNVIQEEEADDSDERGSFIMDDEEDEESEDDDSDSSSSTSSEDDAATPDGKESKKSSLDPEDAEFLSEFDKLMSDSIMSRVQDSGRQPVAEITIPSDGNRGISKQSLFSSGTQGPDPTFGLTFSSKHEPEPVGDHHPEIPMVKITMLTRPVNRGAKPTLKPMQVPVDCDLAISLIEKEEKMRKEKEEIKKLTLHMNERIEENEATQESKGLTVNYQLSREFDGKRKAFQHPKGAPDADLIFGSSSSTPPTNPRLTKR